MSPNSSGDARDRAIDQLEALGLSVYAARTFVALASLGEGTAQDVSEVADVPRTRVYDAVEELEEWGLADVRYSTPRLFWTVSPETAGRRFEQEFEHRVDVLTDALGALVPESGVAEQTGVWTVTGREAVNGRVAEFVASATDEVVLMTVEDLLTPAVLEAMTTASERGVTIRVAGTSTSAMDDIESEVPGVETFESLWSFAETPAGRMLLVDRQQALVSVLRDGGGDNPPEPRDETAIWGSGETNSLVIVLQTMFTWQLAGPDA